MPARPAVSISQNSFMSARERNYSIAVLRGLQSQ